MLFVVDLKVCGVCKQAMRLTLPRHVTAFLLQ